MKVAQDGYKLRGVTNVFVTCMNGGLCHLL
jgi:hypothetical protein